MPDVEDRILSGAVEAASVHGIGRMSVGDVAEVLVDTPDGRRVLLGKASFMPPGAPGRPPSSG